ncbi:MAG: hypothetical protein KDD34_05900 [Bdellovibrionales bacterium]|nr:hypothetical protein [Bdellovibrionales bacterium]
MKIRWLFILITLSVLCLQCSPSSKSQNAGGPIASPTASPQNPNSFHETPLLNPVIGRPVDVQIGDWDSQGSPMPPPPPVNEPFHLKCYGFMQDQLSRKARFCETCDEVSYRLYRLYEFEVDHAHLTVQLENMSYKKIAFVSYLDSTSEVSETYEVDSDLQLEKPLVNLYFQAFENWEQDPPKKSLGLKIHLGQKIADKYVNIFKDFEFNFLTPSLSATAEVFLGDSNNNYSEGTPKLLFEVQCQNPGMSSFD